MTAKFVYDGGDIVIPSELGTPGPGQMQGTAAEQLVEISGRSCYDSLGATNSRPSDTFHPHLVQVKHYSVHEHFHFTIEIDSREMLPFLPMLVNESDIGCAPGTSITDEPKTLRLTLNLRHVLEWCGRVDTRYSQPLLHRVVLAARRLAPAIIPKYEFIEHNFGLGWAMNQETVEPLHPGEKFISMYLRGSRCFSHECCRHRNNMSQRSSRFCDETETEFFHHPLFIEAVESDKTGTGRQLVEDIAVHAGMSRRIYAKTADFLQNFLTDRNTADSIRPVVDKLTARKQARAAARYYLPNGMATEMIYTASVPKWRHIFQQRINPAADAEIRIIMGQALTQIQTQSRYAPDFKDMILVPATDGLGEVLKPC